MGMTRPTPVLRSAAYDLADALEVTEFYQQRGWTDGLPIVPPTEEQVWACLAAAGLAPGDLVGVERVRQRPIMAEKVAINAVMAGCLPAYMPVVVAILRAMCQEPFNLHGSTANAGAVRHVRIPVIPATQSGAKLPPNPKEACHSIRTKAAPHRSSIGAQRRLS